MDTSIKNKVFASEYKSSQNFYKSDLILQHYVENNISKSHHSYLLKRLNDTGEAAAQKMDELSHLADKNWPELIKRDVWGEKLDEIRFHPSYWSLMEIALNTEMFRMKWEPSLREKFKGERNRMSFGTSFLYSMSELGQYCPLCMTDGVAQIIDLFCDENDKKRLLPRIYTNNISELYTGAMFLTEKSGGSDVGANIVTAKKINDSTYALNGEKWFCSNANADIIFALARTEADKAGTRGLSIFLIEKKLKNGSPNPMNKIRLKDKLGVRSMASAEIILEDTIGKLVGNEFEGFNKVMVEMVNLSRLYNAVGAVACSRRALAEAYQFVKARKTFGKPVISHPLVLDKLRELAALHIANFYITWRTIEAMDHQEVGNEKEGEILRILTPMVKKWTAHEGVYITRECMELMGGMGYIEETVLPKLMRDIMVLPIWEGAGNIMTLDMIRASFKSKGLQIMFTEIASCKETTHKDMINEKLKELKLSFQNILTLEKDELQFHGKYFFQSLTHLFQLAVLSNKIDSKSEKWILPAMDIIRKREDVTYKLQLPSLGQVEDMIAWQN